jgi:hypothetical protein
MNLKPEDGDADAIRVSLATLAAGLVADTYRQTGRAPGEQDIRRMVKSLEAVIVFSDNFAPAAEHASRLKMIDGSLPFLDPVQAGLSSIHALVPVMAAIGGFSFGQDPARLVQDVAARLGEEVKTLQSRLSTPPDSLQELVLLQALGQLYAAAHRAETEKLRLAGDSGAGSIDAVWASFATQAAMLAALLDGFGKSGVSSAAGGGGSVKPSSVAPVEATPAAVPPSTGQPSGNPMAFFKKK